jgi:hypothetical protein
MSDGGPVSILGLGCFVHASAVIGYAQEKLFITEPNENSQSRPKLKAQKGEES